MASVPSTLVRSVVAKALIAAIQYVLGPLGGASIAVAAYQELGLWRALLVGCLGWLLVMVAANMSLWVWARQTAQGKISFGEAFATPIQQQTGAVVGHIIGIRIRNSASFPIRFEVQHAYAALEKQPVAALPSAKKFGTVAALETSSFHLGTASYIGHESPLSGQIEIKIRYGLGSWFTYPLGSQGELLVFFDSETSQTTTKLLETELSKTV